MGEMFLDDGDVRLYQGDVTDVLAGMPDESVDCVVTSPPYWGLRDYGDEGQIGLEETPDLFVERIVAVFREVRRVLAPHGTCWVNLGDSYSGANWRPNAPSSAEENKWRSYAMGTSTPEGRRNVDGLKQKDLVGVPWRVAFALQADGWWLRADIIWAKPNPMPESVTDRPTKAHEYVFLLTKAPRYYFDQEAVREPAEYGRSERINGDIYASVGSAAKSPERGTGTGRHTYEGGRNSRSVWQIATQPYPEAHFATYPEELVRRCVLAGCPPFVCEFCGPILSCHHSRTRWRPGVVLDPFIGSGTTCKVSRDHGRHSIGIDLSADYLSLAARRLQQLSLLT